MTHGKSKTSVYKLGPRLGLWNNGEKFQINKLVGEQITVNKVLWRQNCLKNFVLYDSKSR